MLSTNHRLLDALAGSQPSSHILSRRMQPHVGGDRLSTQDQPEPEAGISAALTQAETKLEALHALTDTDPDQVVAGVLDVVRFLTAVVTDGSDFYRVIVNASSSMINAATRLGDVAALDEAHDWLAQVVVKQGVPSSVYGQALFNIANLISARVTATHSVDPHPVAARLKHHLTLSTARVLWRKVAYDANFGSSLRSVAACNLANTLDDSGRWVEAYEFYDLALNLDPTNGNAAGNAALLLDRLLHQGWDHPGHLAALRDHYLAMAKALHHRTVEIAGTDAASRFVAMEAIGAGGGHIRHGGDTEDPFQQWIVSNRLALSPAVEGLGAHWDRWDSATLSAASPAPDDPEGPRSFSQCSML